jgi:hypothetical protein
MKLKENLFERIVQYFVEDGGDMYWWVDSDELEDIKCMFSESFENGSAVITDEKVISGKEWNEWWLGSTFGDCEGVFVNELCNICSHLLVDPEMELESDNTPVIDARFCSNSDCSYANDSYIKANEANAEYRKDLRDAPPEMQIRLAGENVFDFAKRVGLVMDKKEGISTMDDTYWTDCVVCKKSVPVSDYYIGQSTGFAAIHFSHNDCSNSGPSIGTPFKRSAKLEWNSVLSSNN